MPAPIAGAAGAAGAKAAAAAAKGAATGAKAGAAATRAGAAGAKGAAGKSLVPKSFKAGVGGKQIIDALTQGRGTKGNADDGGASDGGSGGSGNGGGGGRRRSGSSGGGGARNVLIAGTVLMAVLLMSGGLVGTLIGPLASVIGGSMASVAGGAAAAATATCQTANSSIPTADAVADIPPIAYRAYLNAAEISGIDWAWIAAIGKVESDHGRYGGGSLDPTTGLRKPPLYGIPVRDDSDNGALDADDRKDRAVGPMQFMPATWRGGAAQDGNFDRFKDPQNIWDAALATGFYLKQRGAPGNMDKAILGYNNSNAYLADVKSWYEKYKQSGLSNSTEGKVVKTQGKAPASQTGPNTVRIAHANLLTSMSDALYGEDLRKMVSYAPDFITLNEVYSRTDRQITPPGYTSVRGVHERDAKEVAVAWRHDRWEMITKGSVLAADTQLRWARRYLSWAMLRDDSGRVVSVVSTHALTNPYPKPRRQVAAKYVATMNSLVNVLGSYGAVIVAGDVNVHYPRDVRDQYPFTPYLGFKGSLLHSTYQLLGNTLVTGDRGATLNWIFTRKPGPLTARRHASYELNSDHRLVVADFDLPRPGTGAAREIAAFGITADSAAAINALTSTIGDPPDGQQDSDGEPVAGGTATLPEGVSVSSALEGGMDLAEVIALGTPTETGTGATGQGPAAMMFPGVAAAKGKGKPSRQDSDWKMPMRPGTFTYTAVWNQQGSSWSSGFHTGLDFAAPTGTPVYAAYAGTIIRRTDQSWAGDKFTIIDHGTIDGKSVFTWYAHLSESYFPTGYQVATGERIGSVGELGNVSGPHLHFEVRVNGVDVDPKIWLVAAGAPDVSGEPGGGCGPTGSSGVVGANGEWGGYENGKIPLSAMCKLSFYDTYLECNAAKALELLNVAYEKEFGRNVGPVGGYRSYEGQVQCVKEKGDLCATPGTSNHGWGLAADLDGGGINSFGTKQHNWMRANAEKFGWILPPWAREGGSKPEPWHWQYGITD